MAPGGLDIVPCLCCVVYVQGSVFADETAEAHAVPYAGDYHFRANQGAEKHLNDPAAIAALQAATQVSSIMSLARKGCCP